MQATILGCGEAFDEILPNTSILVRCGLTLLLDCGYSVPPQVWKSINDPNEIDLIYVSHAHADHYFGLPALLGRMWEEGRTKPLVVLSQPEVLDQIRSVCELGYRKLIERFKFEIQWQPAVSSEVFRLENLTFRFAPTVHAVPNLAMRIDQGSASMCYSGDGMFTDESKSLFSAANLLIHEAYSFEQSPVHADIERLLQMAKDQDVQQLALVHVQRQLRRRPERIVEAIATRSSVHLPEPGTIYRCGSLSV